MTLFVWLAVVGDQFGDTALEPVDQELGDGRLRGHPARIVNARNELDKLLLGGAPAALHGRGRPSVVCRSPDRYLRRP